MNFISYEPNISDRILIALNPIFAWLGKTMPSKFGAPVLQPPHPSAMLTEHNWIYRLIFPRFFKKISINDAEISELRQRAETSTIVYVTKGIGQLEYHYFNHLFLQEGLPLATYTNALTLRRWMGWGAYWNSVISQEHEIEEFGHPADPIDDGSLARMVQDGKSVLLSIPQSGFEDEALFLTGPARALGLLIEAQRMSPKPILIVPLGFMWSRRPQSARRSIVDILFGEKESPGRIRKIVLFWRNYKGQAQATIAKPIDLSSFIAADAQSDEAHLTSKLRSSLMDSLDAKRRIVTGPLVRPRGWFVAEVTSDEALDQLICNMAAEKNKPADDLRDLAARYAREIAADLDYTYIELIDRVMSPVLTRLFESVQVDDAGLQRAKDLYAQGPVVFVPNHKSHMDYLLLSHVMYHHGMTLPLIAAGVNLEFWPIGNIFRHCGAYFIRRAFRGNDLYRAVLETYLKVLLREGYSQEFFIEGGRSRTGKLVKPKKGMLTMLKNAAREAGMSELKYVPVSITYDRVIEQKSYERELEGQSKEKEHAGHILALTKYLRRQRNRYGSIYIRFGDPISAPSGGSDPASIEELAYSICHQINRRMVATPTAIAAAALLSPARRGVAAWELKRNWQVILSALESKGVEISARIKSNPETVMDEAIARLISARLVTSRSDSLEPFSGIDESRRVPLAFFKNGIVHFLVSMGVTSRILLARASGGVSLEQDDLEADFCVCREMLSHEFRFATRAPEGCRTRSAVNFLVSIGAVERTGGSGLRLASDGEWKCRIFAAQIRPFIETLWIAYRYASERMPDRQDERTIISEMMKTGQDLLLLNKAFYREAITKVGFENALRALVSYSVLSLEPSSADSKRLRSYAKLPESARAQNLKAALEKLL